MKRFFPPFHAYILNPVLNLLPCLWIDILYDNMTYLSNVLHHTGLVMIWTISTVLGIYVYSCRLWDHNNDPYHKKTHAALMACMCLSAWIPYQNTFSVLQNIHVWILAVGLIGYLMEWIYIYSVKRSTACFYFIGIYTVCFFSIAVCGHVSALTELLYSTLLNACLVHRLQYKKG